MRKNKLVFLCSVLFVACTLVGCRSTTGQGGSGNSSNATDVELYGKSTDIELLQNVPVMTAEGGTTKIQGDVGAGNQVVSVSGSKATEYWAYLDVLQDNGFEKFVDNGEDGLYGDVLSATLTREDMVLSVIHMVKTNLTYIVAENKLELSPHLHYEDKYVADNIKGAKTTLHMLELSDFGNCFVIQLKNGHFIVIDAGREADLSYLLKYLEDLSPGEEKPVIEAWIITHQHVDHTGALKAFETNTIDLNRIYVEGIYMDSYNMDIATRMGVKSIQIGIQIAANKLSTTDGGHPKIYRPQAGQTYYFNDIKVDVLQTLVQCPEENWYKWDANLNEFSTCLMFQIEDQKYLDMGDADLGSMQALMRTYDSEDFQVDIMSVSHHGINVHNEFSDFISVKTLLYPNFGIQGTFKEGLTGWGGSWQASVDRNEYLQAKTLESYSYGDGTKILRFPYDVGTAESLGQVRQDRVPIIDEHRIKYY